MKILRVFFHKMLQFIIFTFLLDIALTQQTYDGAQLLRLTNLTNSTALDILTEKYGGSIWKHSNDWIDISFKEEYLKEAKNYVNYMGSNFKIIIENIQEIIDFGQPNRTERSTTMNWKKYHDYSIIKSFMYSLRKKYPNIVKLFNIGKSVQDRMLLVLQITNNVKKNKAIWIDGGIHAREWISPASVTYIANYLAGNWKNLPKKLKNKTWYIMPVMNPDGYIYSHNKDRLWRKNRRKFLNNNCIGVDLNRNFNIEWNSNIQSTSICSETYRGAKTFSEPETKAVKKFLKRHSTKLAAYLTYHSYGQYILWPYGFTYSGQAPNAGNMKKVANKAKTNIKARTGKSYTAARSTVVGLIAGASDDWSKNVLGVPYAFTIELRDKGKYGFLLPAKQILGTAKEALEVAKAVAKAL